MSKYTLECIQLDYVIQIFSEEHTLEYELISAIRTARQRKRDIGYYNTSPLSQNYPPCLNIDFYP